MMRQRDAWINGLANIKRIIDTACGDKDPNLCKKWKIHCDVQLYKVLEIQYLRGIEEFDSTSIDIDVEIVYRNKHLSLKPTIEEIKDKYYKDIKNYTEWPGKVFRGITGTLDLYHKIGQQNSQYLGRIYAKAEAAFR
jgi:dynein heavy chain 2